MFQKSRIFESIVLPLNGVPMINFLLGMVLVYQHLSMICHISSYQLYQLNQDQVYHDKYMKIVKS